MTLGFVVFALGLFGVPLALLTYGHKLRRRSEREQNMFWGALVGHCLAGVTALIVGMMPPEAWVAANTARGFLGLWTLLLLPLAGAVIGAMRRVNTDVARSRG